MEYEFLDEFIDYVPQTKKWVGMIEKFIETDHPTMVITCKNAKERNVGLACVRHYSKSKGVELVAGPYKGYSFFVSKPRSK